MFAWLRRILGCASAEECQGAELRGPTHWEVSAPREGERFLRALGQLLPQETFLYFEGVAIAPEVEKCLSALSAKAQLKLALGTIWPRPSVHHIPLTDPNIDLLAPLFRRFSAPEVCDHFHAYSSGEVLLQWHDAFFDDPLLLSSRIPEPDVQEFCRTCACSYLQVNEDSCR